MHSGEKLKPAARQTAQSQARKSGQWQQGRAVYVAVHIVEKLKHGTKQGHDFRGGGGKGTKAVKAGDYSQRTPPLPVRRDRAQR